MTYKICTDCVHYMGEDYPNYFLCSLKTETDLVTGKETYRSCYVERDSEGSCGPAGKNFEPKEEE